MDPVYTVEEIQEELRRLNNKSPRHFYWLGGLLLVVLIIIALALYIFPFVKIEESLTYPSIKEGSYVKYKKQDSYERKDLVVIKNDDGIVIKRVIGLPGEYIEFDEIGNVYINADELIYEDEYVEVIDQGALSIAMPYYIEENTYFVLNDDRFDNDDSRKYGSISKDMILGRIDRVLWPLMEK